MLVTSLHTLYFFLLFMYSSFIELSKMFFIVVNKAETVSWSVMLAVLTFEYDLGT
jgi:hypothetical protein